MNISPELYERAIRAKEAVIRALLKENRRLKDDMAHLEEINDRLLELQAERAEQQRLEGVDERRN